MMEKENRERAEVRPIYKKLLIAAIAIYVIASCIMQADLYRKVGQVEHRLLHILYGHDCQEK